MVLTVGSETRASGNQLGSSQSVAVAGTTEIARLNVSGFERVFVEITTATNNLDAFSIAGRVDGSESFHTFYSASTDFTAPTGLLVGASGDLTALAVGSGWFIMETLGIEELKLTASAATGVASVTVLASGA